MVRAETPTGIAVGGISGGAVEDLVYDPNQADTVYAAASGAGIFKSLDDGRTWQASFLPTAGSHKPTRILVSKAVPGLVLVGEGDFATIYRSTNEGATFVSVLGAADRRCHALAEGTSTGRFFAGITEGHGTEAVARIFSSTDSGLTWVAGAQIGGAGFGVKDLVQLPGGRLVSALRAAGDGISLGAPGSTPKTGGIFFSDDNGATWTQTATVPGQAATGLAFNGTSTLLATTVDGSSTTVWKLTNISVGTGADAWTEVASFAGPDIAARSIRHHPASNTFYVLVGGPFGSLFRSDLNYSFAGATDLAGGLYSSQAALPAGSIVSFAVDLSSANGATILIGATAGGEGIVRTTDGGGNWAISNEGLNAQIVDFALKAPSGHRVVGNHLGYVYFSSADFGSFTKIFRVNAADEQHGVIALALDKSDPARVAVSLGQLPSGGVSRLRLQIADSASNMAEDAPPFDHVGWRMLTLPSTSNPVISLLVDGTTIYAGTAKIDDGATGEYLFKSTNDGASWTPLSLTTVGGVRALAFGATNTTVLYAGSGDLVLSPARNSSSANGIFKSTDSGVTWTRLDSDPTLNGQAPRTILVDPVNPARIWVHAGQPTSGQAAASKDVWESRDGGATWTRITPTNVLGADIALTYLSGQDLLVLAGGGGGPNLFAQTPGSGGTLWAEAGSVYGEVRVLYEGSLGVGTQQGLYEIATVEIVAAADAGPGGAPDAGPDGVGSGKSVNGCGCVVNTSDGASPWAPPVLIALLAFRVPRRRGGRRGSCVLA